MSLTLLDWRRQTAAMYAAVRARTEADPAGTLDRFRADRDRLFREHVESPLSLADRAGFGGLAYWPYDASLRFVARVEPLAPVERVASSLAGRYLIDTVKGADLGGTGDELVLDFNYAYHPSCAYDPRWSCPLAPPANRLEVPVRAGERMAGA